MNYFIGIVQELGVEIPVGVNVYLSDNHKMVDKYTNELLSITTHKEAHKKLKEMDIVTLKTFVRRVLARVIKEKEFSPPDWWLKDKEKKIKIT